MTIMKHLESEKQILIKQFSKILNDHTDIDGLISNAGYGDFGGLETFSFNNIDDYIFTNLVSHILISSMVLPLLKKKQ